jgi:hypothetical protein
MIKQNRFKRLIMSDKPVPNGTDVAMLCACGNPVLITETRNVTSNHIGT